MLKDEFSITMKIKKTLIFNYIFIIALEVPVQKKIKTKKFYMNLSIKN